MPSMYCDFKYRFRRKMSSNRIPNVLEFKFVKSTWGKRRHCIATKRGTWRMTHAYIIAVYLHWIFILISIRLFVLNATKQCQQLAAVIIVINVWKQLRIIYSEFAQITTVDAISYSIDKTARRSDGNETTKKKKHCDSKKNHWMRLQR